jgi:hypothetical protein
MGRAQEGGEPSFVVVVFISHVFPRKQQQVADL